MKNESSQFEHVPVLLNEVIEGLAISKKDIVVDATLGGAGHSEKLAEAEPSITIIGFDADALALQRAGETLKRTGVKHHLVNSNFRYMKSELSKLGIETCNKVLFDLGLGSHTYESKRGFSFKYDEPLYMTLEDNPEEAKVRAYDVVNFWSKKSLVDILWGFGEEKFSRQIAESIVLAREKKLIESTGELVELILRAVPSYYRHGKIHPATRTFQALRIAVNDELNALSEALDQAWDILSPAGRIAVISFHSLEDRIVKRVFLRFKEQGGKIITKKPLIPTNEELKSNPRSRSSKLRIIEKI